MKRRLQFTLRTLFLLMTLAALICAVSVPGTQQYREYQRRLTAQKIDAYILRALDRVRLPAPQRNLTEPQMWMIQPPTQSDLDALRDEGADRVESD